MNLVTKRKHRLLQTQVRISDALQRLLQAENLRMVYVSKLNNLLEKPLKSDIQVMDTRARFHDGVRMDLEDA